MRSAHSMTRRLRNEKTKVEIPKDYDKEVRTRLLKRRIITTKGCWLWTGDVTKGGYGRTTYKSEKWNVHRLSMFLFKPLEFIPSLNVCHKCDIPKCFNPEHLFCASQSVNMLDCVAKGNHYEAYQTYCPKGHEYTESNTMIWHNKRKCRICDNARRVEARLYK